MASDDVSLSRNVSVNERNEKGEPVEDPQMSHDEVECARVLLCLSGKDTNEDLDENEVQCANVLLEISSQEGLDENEVQCANILFEISSRPPRKVHRRQSRRLAGLQPEMKNDFDFNRAFEYVIKDKHQR